MRKLVAAVLRVVLVTVLTAVMISAFLASGWALLWSFRTGNWWWVYPLGIAATVGLYFLVVSKEEHEQGMREMRENFERWKRALTLGRSNTR